MSKKDTFKYKKQEAIQIAKDLFYPETVIVNLRAAKTETQITMIMQKARKAC